MLAIERHSCESKNCRTKRFQPRNQCSQPAGELTGRRQPGRRAKVCARPETAWTGPAIEFKAWASPASLGLPQPFRHPYLIGLPQPFGPPRPIRLFGLQYKVIIFYFRFFYFLFSIKGIGMKSSSTIFFSFQLPTNSRQPTTSTTSIVQQIPL